METVTTYKVRKGRSGMKRQDVVICGGGIAGISAGYHLPGQHVIFEKSSVPGGLAGSIKKDGFTFDHTGHLLHLRDAYASALLLGLLGTNVKKHERKAWIYSHETMTKYPFQANLYGLPKEVIKECVDGFVACSNSPQKSFDPHQSFASWVLDTFGTGFAKHFFFPYNEKLWQTPVQEMTCEWVGQFVPRPSVTDVLAGAATNRDKEFGYNSHFYYPKKGGIQALVDAFMATKLIHMKLNTSVKSINLKKRVVTVLEEGHLRSYQYDALINTLPLPHFLRMIEDLDSTFSRSIMKLRWTSVLNINIGVRGLDPSKGKHWIYFPERQFPFYRVGFPTNFANTVALKGCYSMYVEVAYPGGTLPQGRSEADIVFRCLDALKVCGLLRSSEDLVTVQVNPIPVAYVIYDKYRSTIVDNVLSYLQGNRVLSIGRYGAWHYSFIERCVLQGKAAAVTIENGLETDLSTT